MSSLLTNLSVIQNLAQDLVRPKTLNYSEQCVPYYVADSKFIIDEIYDLVTPSGNKLKSTLIKHKPTSQHKKIHSNKLQKSKRLNNTSNPHSIQHHQHSLIQYQSELIPQQSEIMNKKCIIFLHGLGSSRLESLPLVEHLPKEYCLFNYDSSGSGKSQGPYITYGMKQSQDIGFIIEYLRNKRGLEQFVIWGRSMGAVATLLFIQKGSQIEKIEQKKRLELDDCGGDRVKQIDCIKLIKGIVIDSPFCDFRQITKQIAIKRINIPEFLIDVTLNVIEENFDTLLKDDKTGKVYNPFQINFKNIAIETSIPSIFLYSEIDEVVPKEHSIEIIKKFKGTYQKITMQNCTHNQTRPKEAIQQIFQVLKKFTRKTSTNCHRNQLFRASLENSIQERRKSRGISLMQSLEKSPKRSSRKLQGKDNQSTELIKKPLSAMKQGSYSSQKIEPKTSKKIRNYQTKTSTIGFPESINNLIDKFRTINYGSQEIEKQEEKKNPKNKPLMFNTIETQNNEFIRKKLNHPDFDTFQNPNETKPIFKGRRKCRVNKKLQYQLNHTRYL